MAERRTRRSRAGEPPSSTPERMSEPPASGAPPAAVQPALAVPAPQTFLERVIAQLRERVRIDLHVGMAFGPEREIHGRTIIPVAWVVYGYGAGGGNAVPSSGSGAVEESRASSGGGGGGGGFVQPIALIEVSDRGTRVLPIVDWTRLAARVLAAVLPLVLPRRSRR